MKLIIIPLSVLLSVTSCAQDQTQPVSRTSTGAILGGLLGAGAGAALGKDNRGLGAALGGLAGALLGGLIGSRLDAQSEARRQAALTQLARNTERPSRNPPTVRWSNPAQNTSGIITVRSPVTTIKGRRCMEVNETITIGGQPKQVQEMRCETADGQWI